MPSDLAPTGDLGTWMRQQVDEDERVAQVATPGPWCVGESGEVETVAQYGTPGYERPFRVTQDAEGISPAADENDAPHIARHDPARVFREVEAKRRIMSIHRRPQVDLWGSEPFEDCCDGCGYSGGFGAPNVRHIGDCPELRALAAVYSDRPGYDDEWRPAPMPPSDS